jgi:hypothetical protein
MGGRIRAGLAAVLLGAPLGGCEVREYVIAHGAPELLVGLSANDLRLCAGLPDRSATGAGAVRYWSYERSVTVGTGSVSLTQVGVSLSGAEECRATFELTGDRVSRLAFTRVAASSPVAEAACAPLVTTCVDMVRRGMVARRLAPPP